jgi:hypothetical protein
LENPPAERDAGGEPRFGVELSNDGCAAFVCALTSDIPGRNHESADSFDIAFVANRHVEYTNLAACSPNDQFTAPFDRAGRAVRAPDLR